MDPNASTLDSPRVGPESWLNALRWRYAVKRFDPEKQIEEETWAAIEQSLVLTPSSFGLQPWRFVVVTSQDLKDQLPALSWGQTQPKDCSHLVVMTSLREVNEDYLERYLTQIAEARSQPVENLSGFRNVILGFLKATRGNHAVWSTYQVYIALGQLMATAAALGVDACPMEGIEPAGYDALLGLENSPYATRVACALGYRHAEDGYARSPKVRFPISDMVRYL
jgi:nitroreductase